MADPHLPHLCHNFPAKTVEQPWISLCEHEPMELQLLLFGTALFRIRIRPPSTMVQYLLSKRPQRCTLRDPTLDEAVPRP